MKATLPSFALLLLPFTTGCVFHVGGSDGDYGEYATQARNSPTTIARDNRGRLSELQPGMTEAQVREVLRDSSWNTGSTRITNPHRRESFPLADGRRADVLYYYTETHESDGLVSEDELTPLYFEDGALVGWGRSGFDVWQARVSAR